MAQGQNPGLQHPCTLCGKTHASSLCSSSSPGDVSCGEQPVVSCGNTPTLPVTRHLGKHVCGPQEEDARPAKWVRGRTRFPT